MLRDVNRGVVTASPKKEGTACSREGVHAERKEAENGRELKGRGREGEKERQRKRGGERERKRERKRGSARVVNDERREERTHRRLS